MSSHRPAISLASANSRRSLLASIWPRHGRAALARIAVVPLTLAAGLFATPVAAQQIDCDLEGSLKAVSGNAHVDLTFQNPLAQSLRLYWIDFQGRRKPYGAIEPGGTRQQPTSEGNHWLVADDADKCIAIFTAPASATTFVIAMPNGPIVPGPAPTAVVPVGPGPVPFVGGVPANTATPVYVAPPQTIVVTPGSPPPIVVNPTKTVVMPVFVPIQGQPVKTPVTPGPVNPTPITSPPTTPPVTPGPVTTPPVTPVTPITSPPTTPPVAPGPVTTPPVIPVTNPPVKQLNTKLINHDRVEERVIGISEKKTKVDEAKALAAAKAAAAKVATEQAKLAKAGSKNRSTKLNRDVTRQEQQDKNAAAQATARAKADVKQIKTDQILQVKVQKQLTAAQKGVVKTKPIVLPKKCGKPKCT